jgi:mannose-1-phosphate guanylyltransferase / mannose-6-phosphate isomerase
MKIQPVILSGGAGTRLWPLSRELHPKQLLSLFGEHSLLQQTAQRLQGLDASPPVVVCNEAHRFQVAEQLRQAGHAPGRVILEPVGRNTAPAIGLAAAEAVAQLAPDDDCLLLVLPADHVIRDVAALQAAIAVAARHAASGAMVTFGVVPTAPETGYGYIKRGAARDAAYLIDRFVEKPPVATAQQYQASGEYYWNSGIFMFAARAYLSALQLHAPDIAASVNACLANARRDQDFVRPDSASFKACRADSIDYAVMEKVSGAVVVPLAAGWSDVGSFPALQDAAGPAADGNVLRGDVLTVDTEGSLVHASSRLVATVGLRDHVVIETKDAVLVAPRSRAQDVKSVVAELKAAGRSEANLHREVQRPWGSYDSLDNGPRHQVKRLTVKPGGVLSLQLHHHRAEHWVVVAGVARITLDDQVFLRRENEYTYIPIGAKHRIENPGPEMLHIIEVQAGGYLGEDDIVRFEDNYGRQGTNT